MRTWVLGQSGEHVCMLLLRLIEENEKVVLDFTV